VKTFDDWKFAPPSFEYSSAPVLPEALMVI
jgi:hypothetical protein